MLKKFRRSSRIKPQPQQDNTGHVLTTDAQSTPRTGFFSLPAELRNDIYELAARETDLCLLEHRKGLVGNKKPSSSSLSIPGLLLSSRQVRTEYLPILIRGAKINVKVLDFDFSQLLRAIKGLENAAREAIQSNKNLTITLRMKKCGANVASGLRAWCVGCNPSARIPWDYQLDKSNMEDIREGQAGAVKWYVVRASVLFEQERDNDVRRELTKILEALHLALEEEMSIGPRSDSVLMTSSWRPGMYL
ncbi:hypothetical protein M409DRAFT_56377 [Zasmidium cellare ATCC 36951]|uniref:F-box domain-containing protein n=1 Tax=Zasmidium cellare ATCC 36951 TaxID=1080233 RepID=A0A6A6CBG3_ZASCE|nr:uncharacterized protein M409DRAFT_56377 [Zasmidium cellare ATCC 36951]KAF2164537.1 hypothetical protein M409DRAFT_56377 [Zasmidium cellare ATCC 36951]